MHYRSIKTNEFILGFYKGLLCLNTNHACGGLCKRTERRFSYLEDLMAIIRITMLASIVNKNNSYFLNYSDYPLNNPNGFHHLSRPICV